MINQPLSEPISKKVIVTGGAGFIGSNLVDKLVSQGYKVIVIDNLSAGKKENLNPEAEFHELDICDFDKINPLFQGVDCVFHLAAIPRVPVSVKDPINTSKTNIIGTVSVFKAASENKVKRVIFASSSSVYGEQEEFPLKEGMAPNPVSPYALQKLSGEQFAKLFMRLYGLSVVCLRYFNVYGPRIDPDSEYSLVLGKFLKQKSQNSPLTIFGDGEQTRGFCYVDDVVDGNIKAMESLKLKGGEIINIGNNESNSINYLAKLIGGEIQYFPTRAGDVLHTKADISLAKELLGWQPSVSFDQGIKKTMEWFTNK
jgi:nucleoside-diphosphate-sugar epimerase